MINLNAIENMLIDNENGSWGLTSGLMPDALQDHLFNIYPKIGFKDSLRNEPDRKQYAFNILDLVKHNQYICQSLTIDNQWLQLSDALMSSEYVEALSDKFSLDLRKTIINIGFYKFSPGNWVSPHVDNEDKILTQIFYFNPVWSNQWGGCLKLLKNSDPSSCYYTVPPLADFSVFVPRTRDSWHMVTPVQSQALESRLSLQLEFIKG